MEKDFIFVMKMIYFCTYSDYTVTGKQNWSRFPGVCVEWLIIHVDT